MYFVYFNQVSRYFMALTHWFPSIRPAIIKTFMKRLTGVEGGTLGGLSRLNFVEELDDEDL